MKVIDLFSGAGGFSLGFKMAGFDTVLSVEKDLWASETYKFNNPNTKVINDDIKLLTDLSQFGLSEIDCIIGGPPCQGFSLSGNRDPKDPRNSLFMEFLRFVKYFKPKIFVMENVPGLLSMKTTKGEKVIDLIIDEFKSIGYTSEFKVLNSAEYGVPQLRRRVFIIGTNRVLDFSLNEIFPMPHLLEGNFLTIKDAISDLPKIESGEGLEWYDYISTKLPINDYQKWARENSNGICNHVSMRHTPRLKERFSVIREGQSLKDVPAEHMQRKRGDVESISGKVYSQNNNRPFYDKPSPTITASFQSNYIHPLINRNFTAREAARLQSFPDSYVFKGKRTTMSWEKNLSQFQQIGNAVPPLLAKAIAKNILGFLKS